MGKGTLGRLIGSIPRTPLEGPLRHLVGGSMVLVAVAAFVGGYYAMVGAPAVPVGWLRGTPFRSYFLPGLILFELVGGSMLFAGLAVLARVRFARLVATVASLILVGWLLVELAVIGSVTWPEIGTVTLAAMIAAICVLWPPQSSRTASTVGSPS